MTMGFATLADVKASLRMLDDQTDDDALLSMLLDAATTSVANYLKSAADALSVEGATIPAEVRVATVMLVGILYKANDNNRDGDFERGYLPDPVTALLYPLRDPALA